MLNPILISAVGGVCFYYLIAWLLVGRDPRPGLIMTIYDPPRGISPAMLRYVWKQVFDDRVVWSILLSLVAKGLATIRAEENSVVLHATPAVSPPHTLA